MPRARHSAAPRAIRTRPLVAAVIAAAGLATAIWLPTRFDNAEATEGDRGDERSSRDDDRVVFADDFAGRRGASVDREKWSSDTGAEDGELQIFTDSLRNAGLDGDGNLVLTARRERSGGFTSARLLTRETFAGESGRVEARIKVADNRGIRSVFQLLGGDGGGDVDVLDNLGSKSREVRGAIGDRAGSLTARRSFAEEFHVFAVDWGPGRVVWSVDGDEFFRAEQTLDEPFTASLALTVGDERAGRPDDSTRFPQRMLVDFVRVTAEEAAADEPPPTTPPATTTPTTTPTTPPPAATTPPAPAARPWRPFTLYSAGERVTFDGRTYEVKDAHTSLPGWEPPAVPILFRPL
jgi:beta-glucanase (GH16 family)